MPAIPGATDGFVVARLDRARDLTLTGLRNASTRATWEFLLRELPGGRTRLVTRGRVASDWLAPSPQVPGPPRQPLPIERVYGWLAKLPRWALVPFAGFGHHLMVSRQLHGIRHRAESAREQRGEQARDLHREAYHG